MRYYIVNMKLKSILLLAITCFISISFGAPKQSPIDATKQNPITVTKQNHFLWKVSDANSHVWLLGSIHMATSEIYPLAPIIDSAFQNSSDLVIELDSQDPNMQTIVQDLIKKHGYYPKGNRLDLNIKEKTLDRLDSLCRAWGIPSANFYGLKPWLVSISLGVIALQKVGMDKSLGIDLYFQNKASERKMPVHSLETADEQLSIFYDLPDVQANYLLEYTLSDIGTTINSMDSLQIAWIQGDTVAIEKFTLKEFSQKEFTSLYKKLFTDRNIKMANKVKQWLAEDKTAFVVVGSGHLVGKEGVPRLLSKKYTVQQQSTVYYLGK